jgi:hypothetical protein
MSIFEVGDKVILGAPSEWAPGVEVGSVGTVTSVYTLGDEFFDGPWDQDDDGYDVEFEGFADAYGHLVAQTIEEKNLFDGNRSVYKVERKVDTVCVEMDVHVAEQLVAVLNEVIDQTHAGRIGLGNELVELRQRLVSDAEVRYPSPMYIATGTESGFLVLTNRI